MRGQSTLWDITLRNTPKGAMHSLKGNRGDSVSFTRGLILQSAEVLPLTSAGAGLVL